jgi:hypothetical protein
MGCGDETLQLEETVSDIVAWALIVLLGGQHPSITVTAARFTNKAKCEDAAKQLRELAPDQKIETLCVKE